MRSTDDALYKSCVLQIPCSTDDESKKSFIHRKSVYRIRRGWRACIYLMPAPIVRAFVSERCLGVLSRISGQFAQGRALLPPRPPKEKTKLIFLWADFSMAFLTGRLLVSSFYASPRRSFSRIVCFVSAFAFFSSSPSFLASMHLCISSISSSLDLWISGSLDLWISGLPHLCISACIPSYKPR